jgi:hypothetical protein
VRTIIQGLDSRALVQPVERSGIATGDHLSPYHVPTQSSQAIVTELVLSEVLKRQ